MAKGLYEKGGKERPADPRCHIIRERCAVNDRTLAPVQKLNVEPQDNFLSQQLNGQAGKLVKEMSQLRSAAFDHSNAENELGFEGP